MSYIATIADLTRALEPDQLAQLSNDDTGLNTTGEETEAVLQSCLDRAESWVESFASARYVVPLTLVSTATEYPPLLVDLVVQLAIVYLHQRRGWTLGENQKWAYDQVVRHMERVRRGDAEIPHCLPSANVTSVYTGDTQTMTQSSLSFFG